MERRNFLASIPILAAIPHLQGNQKTPLLSSNSYNWHTFYNRAGKQWNANLDADFSEYKKTGFNAYEPAIADPEEASRLVNVLSKYSIAMPSVYIGSLLHEKTEIDKATANILAIADIIEDYGTKIIVTNPNPIEWGSDKLKTDAQLSLQSTALENIGKKLRNKGIKLAYHTHDIEMKAGAREFHHMLQNTSPQNLYFCMDIHWIYRGSGNSQIAVFDVLKMYGHRIIELHIRQSKGGIWQETFTEEGDIDYKRFISELHRRKIFPHLVMEQCLETKSPNTMDAYQAHALDYKELLKTFDVLIKR